MTRKEWRGSRVLWVIVLVALATLLAGCIDRFGSDRPSIEERMAELGLPMDVLTDLDTGYQVLVRNTDGVPELLVFRQDSMGTGSTLSIWRADRPTANGGTFGTVLNNTMLFGAGQGPLDRVDLEGQGVAQIINPDINGWVISGLDPMRPWATRWSLVGPSGDVLYETVGGGLPTGHVIDDATGAYVVSVGGGPTLVVYTTNRYGGADAATWTATTPTIDGALMGTATVGDREYLFGGSQRTVVEPVAPGATVEGGQNWLIALPEGTALDGYEWWLKGQDGLPALAGVGADPKAIFVDNQTVVRLTVLAEIAPGQERILFYVDPGQVRLWPEIALKEPGFGRTDGCTGVDLVARDPSGAEVARRAPPMCAASLDRWVVEPRDTSGSLRSPSSTSRADH